MNGPGDSFFRQFFAALDSDDPESAMAYVADDLQFSIIWAGDETAKARQFTGGPEELRSFTQAGDTTGWAHHILQFTRENATEVALGETRWDADGSHIGTFIVAGELDAGGKLLKYFTTRSPVLRFTD